MEHLRRPNGAGSLWRQFLEASRIAVAIGYDAPWLRARPVKPR